MIILHTNKGDIKIELDFDKAPVTAKNFEQYVKDGFYDGVIFHRVIKGFMIQGGGMDENMNEKETRDPIQNEASNGLPNEKYTIAMARTSDPHSASAQFFINTADNAFLNFRSKELYGKTVVQDWGYAVFGKVVDGFDVVDAIEGVSTKRHGYHDDVPSEPVIITKAEVVYYVFFPHKKTPPKKKDPDASCFSIMTHTVTHHKYRPRMPNPTHDPAWQNAAH